VEEIFLEHLPKKLGLFVTFAHGIQMPRSLVHSNLFSLAIKKM